MSRWAHLHRRTARRTDVIPILLKRSAELQARNTVTQSNASPWLVAAGGAGWVGAAGGLWYLSTKGNNKLRSSLASTKKTQQVKSKPNGGFLSKLGGKASALRRLKFWKRHDSQTGVSETIERRQSKPKGDSRDLTKKQYAALWGTMGGVTGGLLIHAGWTGYQKYRKQAAELRALNRPFEPNPQLAKEVPLVTQPAAKIGGGGLFSKITGIFRKVPHLRRREMGLDETETLQGEEPSFLGARDGTTKKAVGGTAGVLGAGAIGFGAGAGLYYARLHHKEMRSLKNQGLMPVQAARKPMSVDGSLDSSKNAFKSALSRFGRFKIFKRDQGTATTATLGGLTVGALGLAGAAGYHAYKQDRKMKMLQNGLYSTTRKHYATAQLGGGGLTKLKNVFSAGLSKLGRLPKIFKRHEMPSSSPAPFELQM
ncbi:hypothetical protein IE81DRAFT_222757 [Ceraceosorus guamensis]|uniref:Uncharacterized protein n=1 Tax=Ceraceosorus guamensis TaxID=1522189 RepID=A0A316VS03_9BASI|nr:hypothetical protein IE81DRAFT_222757 [Ceraceosorus guamensis]PWN40377.1 hypothetical protein IE81DRAFT_222757 [Ceraceosorus guamensis]